MYKLCYVLFLIILLFLAILSFKSFKKLNRRVDGGGLDRSRQIIKWDGPSTCYQPKMIKECQIFFKDYIYKNHQFGIPTENDRKKFQIFANRLSAKYAMPISLNTCISIYYMEVIFEIQVRSSAVEKYSSEIVSKFKNGSSVIVISKQLHLPPLAVLKVVLLSKGLNHSTIKSMVSMREPMHKDFTRYLNELINLYFSVTDEGNHS